MASPPFSLSTATPADNGIVSQFPLDERTLRDIIQSWLLANHDTNGNHNKIIMPWSSTPATPSASLITVYADSVGRLRYVDPTGTLNIVGVPPGVVFHGAFSSIPPGYLVADGSAVSRSTYADLYSAIGIIFGAGDGSTTFNLPDAKGRVFAGEDGSGVRLSATYFGTTAALGAASTILDHITLATANLPPYTPSGSVGTSLSFGGYFVTTAGGPLGYGGTSAGGNITSAASATSTFTGSPQGGTSTPFSIVQPTIILKAIIKT
jgi:microcystin-dependent protein